MVAVAGLVTMKFVAVHFAAAAAISPAMNVRRMMNGATTEFMRGGGSGIEEQADGRGSDGDEAGVPVNAIKDKTNGEPEKGHGAENFVEPMLRWGVCSAGFSLWFWVSRARVGVWAQPSG